MNKHVPVRPSPGRPTGITARKERYYVQPLTAQIFVIRERLSTETEPGPNDRIVRSFSIRYDAYACASTLNERQRKLDEENDRRS